MAAGDPANPGAGTDRPGLPRFERALIGVGTQWCGR